MASIAFRIMHRVTVLASHFPRPQVNSAKYVSPAMYTVSSRSTSSAAWDDWVSKCRQVQVLDSKMSYYDSSAHNGFKTNTVLFLHGNPTSSFLWRNIIPHVQKKAWCLAPDLIGMGNSAKLPNHDYSYKNQYRYLKAWIEAMNLPEKLVIVCHDWGSGLGLHWCNEHRSRVKAIVHMESLVSVAEWKGFPEIARSYFQAMRSDAGEDMILKKNLFIERLLPSSIIRTLSEDEMNAYRMPYVEEGESRRPTLTWPREIPVREDGPQDVIDITDAYVKYLSDSKDIPKLYINGDPGFFSDAIRHVTKNWPNHRQVTVKGLHFLQEDSPNEIGKAIADFLDNTLSN
uniref:Renilla-luciferin 2-monooxygenase-like n=1 Tax=Saccoglossus kowalevskii TaxID=10224 RepID=A0ABM0GVM9_SACKO|nr:PREDICTED: renilla-luciferin 2-monooxygenase-like [Saccoglossus kowalevskii]